MTYRDDGLEEQAWMRIAPGFTTRADVIEAMTEAAEDDESLEFDPQDVEPLINQLWRRRLDQLSAPRPDGSPPRNPTDDQRVADTFAALRTAGLVAEMNCGWDSGEGGELCKEQARREGADGYVFFHSQDAERLAESPATLFLGFDAVAPAGQRFETEKLYDEAAVAVGHRIAQALLAHGLSVAWDATAQHRIEVRDLDWRRPLPMD